ncbi:PilZ domain-containing protein [Tardiphaga sp.]|uniref:PilZ domain-containing protein n=1 Tax=Tardiphaga sp. TaxID=1926292 RepID=UPI0026150BD0|nr:PilZ domain-containing protein [Tardiphaga sp.]MDB5620666.1 type pilus assembly PilZ [Tardiphaga sp.]
MTNSERCKDVGVVFERGFDAHIMAIDGTWRRACIMTEASESGASLTIIKSVEGLTLTEFFLLLSTTGLAYRRCELAWINGDKMGVTFLLPGRKTKVRSHQPSKNDLAH